MKKIGWQRIFFSRLSLMIVGFILISYSMTEWVASVGGPEAMMSAMGSWAAILIIPVHAVLAASPFPSDLIVIAMGAAFGVLVGTTLANIGYTLGAILEYDLVVRGKRCIEVSDTSIRLPRWLTKLPMDHPAFLIIARQFPLGFHIVNIGAASFGVSRWRHGWCLLIANVPRSLLMAAIGAGLYSL